MRFVLMEEKDNTKIYLIVKKMFKREWKENLPISICK